MATRNSTPHTRGAAADRASIIQAQPDYYTPDALRAPGWLARQPMIGVILFALGSLAFAYIAYNIVSQGPLVRLDMSLYKQLYASASHAPGWMIEWTTFGFFWGKEMIQVIVVILGLYFLHKRFWTELAMLLIGSIGGSLIWHFFNVWFQRPRPPAQLGIVVTNPSFPSGHTSSAVLCYGFLAYFLIPLMPSRFWKGFVIVTALLIIAFCGFSRVFLGGHYLTDVLGGYALGTAWAGFAYTVIERFSIQRRMNHAKKR
ncbi:MAG: phosphatase PAP2 family protein [Bacteroidota bacterium]